MERRVWWLVAAIGLVTTFLHAERLFADQVTLPYCIERGRLAIDIAKTVQGGLTMDRINLEYAIPPASEEEASNRQEWVAELKGEIVVLMQTVQDPEMVGQKVLERCAYAYGKLRRTAAGQNSKEYCWYRIKSLAGLFDVVKQVGSVEGMLKQFPPPDSLSVEAATGMVNDILDATDRDEYLKTEWLKCTGGQI